MKYVRTWHEFECPNCKAANFYNDGDLSDFSTDNCPDILKCGKCGKCSDGYGIVTNEDECEIAETCELFRTI